MTFNACTQQNIISISQKWYKKKMKREHCMSEFSWIDFYKRIVSFKTNFQMSEWKDVVQTFDVMVEWNAALNWFGCVKN